MHKITHLTSVHSRYDTRIFLKECRSLAQAGFDVSLVVADGKGDEQREGVNIYDVGTANGRIDRIRNVTRRVFEKARSLDADIYHLHDPELIPIGLKLKKLGKKVIFDAHEDVPKQLLSKPYLNTPAKWFLSNAFALYERYACSRLDGIITATPFIRDKFLTINPCSVDIKNYPMLDEFETIECEWKKKDRAVCYAGGISAVRGIREMVTAIGLTDARLLLAGTFSPVALRNELTALKGWNSVEDFGFVDRSKVSDILLRSSAGLVVLHPIINYLDSLPIKMFEYMAAGIPVVASNFPLWRKIIEENDCGICVDPLNPDEIAQAITWLLDHPEEAKRMGENGRRAVEEKYTWECEGGKLVDLYNKIFT